jgi:filamentous hemagglutinin family protein
MIRGRSIRALLAAALTTSALSPALSQSAPVAAPPLQPANSNTSLDVTPGGTPIINIAAPDTGGTSHNVFTTLSAGKEGLIFNNSPVVGQSAIGGFILANPNLTKSGQSAGLILNEVTGGVRTSLSGPLEIFGGRAALVIANPTGITCDGCGFINMSRVTLSSGRLVFGSDGAYAGLLVDSGDVSIEGKGLLAGNVDYFDIVAGAAHINASLYARDLVVAGGTGRFDAAQRTANGSGSGSGGIAIDSALLGGMYANRIRLIGTGQGVGVNLAGTLATLDGPLTISSDGAITLDKTAASGDATIASGSGTITLTDQTYAGGKLALSGLGLVQSGGFAGALGDVEVKVASDVSLGGQGLYAGLDSGGDVTGTGNLSLSAGGAIDLGSSVLAAGGSIGAQGAALSQASAGKIAGQTIRLVTSGAQNLGGSVNSVGGAAVSGDSIALTGSLTSGGALALSGRKIVVAGEATGLASASVAAGETLEITSTGKLQSNNAVQLVAPSLTNAGLVMGVGAVSLDAGNVVSSGKVVSGGNLAVAASGDADIAGSIAANGNAGLAVKGSAQISGTLAAAGTLSLGASDLSLSGTAQAGGALTLSGQNGLTITGSGQAAAGGAANLTTAGTLTLDGAAGSNLGLSLSANKLALNGSAQAQGNLTLNATDLVLAGSAVSGADAAVLVTGAADIAGTLSAKGNLALSAPRLATSAPARMLAGNSIVVTAPGSFSHAGTLSGGAVTISAGDLANSGLIAAQGAMALGAATSIDQAGQVQAGGTLSLTAPSLRLAGQTIGAASGAGSLSITAPQISFAATSDLQSGGALSLSSSGDFTTQGKIVVIGSLLAQSQGALTQNAVLSGNGAVTLNASSVLAQTGTISAAGPVSLAASTITNSGFVASGDVLQASAVQSLSSSGSLLANKALSLRAQNIALSGTTTSNDVLTLAAPSVSLAGTASGLNGVAAKIGDLTLSASGTLQSGTSLGLDLISLDNAGLISAGDALSLWVQNKFANSGQIVGASSLDLTARSGLTSNGLLQAGSTLTSNIQGNAQLGGTLYAGTDLRLTGTGLALDGAVVAKRAFDGAISGAASLARGSSIYAGSSAQLLAGDLTAAGTIQSDGSLALVAGQTLNLGGSAQGSGPVTLSAGTAATLSGTLASGGALLLTAPTIGIPGQILANDTVSITASGDNLSLAGTIQAARDVGLTAVQRLTIGVAGTAPGTGAGSTTGSGTSGTGTASGSGGTSTGTGTVSGSASGSTGGVGTTSFTLNVPQLASALPGSLASGGAVLLSAADIDIYGTVAAKGDLSALASHILTVSGSAWSDGALTANAGSLAIGKDASLAAMGPVKVAAVSDISNLGTLASNAGDLTLSYGGLFSNTGAISAKGAYSVTTASDYAAAGSVAAGTVSIAARDLTLSGSMIAASGLSLSGRTITLAGGSDTQSGAGLSITGSGSGLFAGKLLSAGDLAATFGGGLNIQSTADLGAGGKLTFKAGGALNTLLGSKLAAGGAAGLSAADMTLAGSLATNGALNLASSGGMSVTGTLTSVGSTDAVATGALSLTGALAAGGKLSVTGGAVTLGGTINAIGDTGVSASGLAINGSVVTSGALSVTSTGDIAMAPGQMASGSTPASGASLAAAGSLTLRAGGNAALSGQIGAGGVLDLVATDDLASGDLIASNSAVTLSGRNVTLGGPVGAGTSLAVTASGTLGGTGALSSGWYQPAGAAAPGGGATSLTAVLINYGGAITANGSVSAASTANSLTLAGPINAAGALNVASAGDLTLANLTSNQAISLSAAGSALLGGNVQSGGAFDLTAGSIILSGSLAAGSDLGLSSKLGDITVHGPVSALGAARLISARDLTADGALVANGLIDLSAARSATLAAIWAGHGDGKVSVGGALTLTGTGGLVVDGANAGTGQLTLAAGSLDNAGRISSSGALGAVVNGDVTMRASGVMVSGGKLTLAAASWTSAEGSISASNDALALDIAGAANLGGHIGAQRDSTIAVGSGLVSGTFAPASGLGGLQAGGSLSLLTRSGDLGTLAGSSIQAGGNLALSSAANLSAAGSATANGSAALSAVQTLVSSGNVVAQGPVSLTGTSLSLGGTIGTNSTLAATASGTTGSNGALDVTGTLSATDQLTLTGGLTAIGIAARIETSDAASLTVGTLTSSGAVSGVRGVSLTSSGDMHLGGSVAAGTVTAQGQVGSLAALALSAGGNLALTGTASATGDASLAASGDLSTTGSVISLGNTRLTSATLHAGGTLAANGVLEAVTAGDAALTGTLTGLGGIAMTSGGVLDQAGALGSNHAVSLGAARSLTQSASGSIGALGDIALTGQSLALGGSVSANGALSLVSTGGSIQTLAASTLAARTTSLTSAGDAIVAGTLLGTSSLDAHVTGSLLVAPSGTLQAGTSDSAGNVTSLGAMNLGAATSINNAGLIFSTGTLTLAAPALVNSGTISTGADISFSADSLDLGGTFVSLGNISAATRAGALNLTGGLEGKNVTLSAIGGDLTLAVTSHVTAYGTGTAGLASLSSDHGLSALGVIAANNDATLSAVGAIHLGADTGTTAALASQGNVTLLAGGALTSDGSITAGGNLGITAASLSSNNLASGGALTAETTGAIALSGASYGARGVTFGSSAAGLSLASSASVQSPLAIRLTAAGDITSAGSVIAGSLASGSSGGAITMVSGGTLSSSGALVSNNDSVSLTANALVLAGAPANGGGLYAAGALSLNAPTLTLGAGGQVVSNQALSYTGTSLTLDSASLLQSNQGVTITLSSPTSSGSYSSAGSLVALTDLALTVTGGAITNQGGSAIFAGGAGAAAPGGSLSLSANALANAGTIAATRSASGNGGNVAVTAPTVTSSGLIHADGALNLAASSLALQAGGIAESSSSLSLAIPTITLASGSALQSAGAITSNGTSFSSAGSLLAGGNISLVTSGNLTSTGTLASPGAVSLTSGGAVTLAGITSAGTTFTARSASANLGGTVQAWNTASPGAASLAISATGGPLAVTGNLVSSGALSLTSSGALTFSGAGSAYGASGVTASGDTILIASSASPSLASSGNVALTAVHGLTLSGGVAATGSISLVGGDFLTLDAGSLLSAGTAQASPSVTASSVSLSASTISANGTLAATGGLSLSAGNVAIGGTARVNGDIAVSAMPGGAAPAMQIAPGASLTTYFGSLSFGTLSSLDLGGTALAASGSVSLTAPGATVRTGGLIGAGTDLSLTMSGGGALSVDGQLLAGRNIALSGGTLGVGQAGIIHAGNDLSFTTSDYLTGSGALSVNGVSYNFAGTPISAQVSGALIAGHDLALSMPGALILTETSQAIAEHDLTLGAGHALIASQFAGGRLGVIAGNDVTITNSGALGTGSLGARGLVLDGSLQAGRNLSVNVDGEVTSTAASQMVAGNALSVSGSALSLAGFNSAQTGVAFAATGTAPAGVTLTLDPGAVTLAGATASNGRVALAASTATITGSGSITALGGLGAAAALGRNMGAAANIDLETTGALTNNGAIWSDGLVFLKSASGNIINNAAGANGGMTASTIITQADGGSFLNQAGAFKAANVGLFLGGDFVNAGSFAPSGNYWISAANITNSGLLAASGSLRLDASGNLTNTGTIFAGNNLTLNVEGTLANTYVGDDLGNGSHGMILAQNDISITAHDVVNESATIQSLAGNIGITLTGGNLTNTIKKLQISQVPGTGIQLPGGLVGLETEEVSSLFARVGCGGFGFLSNGNSATFNCFSSTQLKVTYRTPSGHTVSYTLDYFMVAGQDDTVALANTGTASIAAAGNLEIDTGPGSLTNRNSALLAGGNLSIVSSGTVDNVADLLIQNVTSSGTNSLANSTIPGAPTLIRAGGTVSVQAGTFNNIANNLVGADSFTSAQVQQGVTGAGPTNLAPTTGSTGNSATRGIGATSGANGGSLAISGSAAAPANASVGSGSATSAANLAGTGSGSRLGSGTSGTTAEPNVGAATSSLRMAAAGSEVAGFSAGEALSAGTAGTAGNAGSSQIAGSQNLAGGSSAVLVDGAGQGSTHTVSAAANGVSALTVGGVMAGTSGANGVQLVTAAINGVSGTSGSAAQVGSAETITAPGSTAGLTAGTGMGTPLTADLVTTFNGAGLPSLSNQGFGTFLGQFLSGFNLTGNSPSLFTYNANPDSAYLFTTSAALSSEAALYDSKWFFDRLAPDRMGTYTRLGDGFFEAMLVAREVQAASGEAQLSRYGSVLDQYQGLLNNAATNKDKLGLNLGIGLTNAQVAALTEPMLWYVSAQVAGRDVLVPVLYLAASDQKAIANTALISGKNVLVSSSGSITNSGAIQASQVVALAANGGDLVNAAGGKIVGGTVVAQAARDIVLQGGSTIAANGSGTYVLPGGAEIAGGVASLSAGRDIVSTASVSTAKTVSSSYAGERSWSNSASTVQSVTGASIASSAGTQLTAGGNIALDAAKLSSGGATSLVAGGNVTLGGTQTVTTTTTAERTGKYTNAAGTSTSSTFVGTSITAAGPIAISALDGKLSVTGGTIQTTNPAAGDITLYGGQGVNIAAGQNTASSNLFQQTGKRSTVTTTTNSTTASLATIDAAGKMDVVTPGALTVNGGVLNAGGALSVSAGSVAISGVIDQTDTTVATYTKKKGLLSSTTTRTNTVTSDQSVVGSTLSGDTVNISTPGAVAVAGSNVVASNGLAIAAGGPVSIGTLATVDTQQQSMSVKKSGISLSGGGLFIGVAKTATTQDTTATSQIGSLIGSENGDVSIVSADKLSVTGSKIAAGGDVLLAGKSIDIANALDVTDSTHTAKSSSVGVNIGVQSQVLQSATNLVDAAQIATSTGSDRVAAVAGLAGGMSAVNAYNAGKDLAATIAKGTGSLGVSVGVSFGISKSSSSDKSHDETVVSSQVTGNNVTLLATGAGQDGSIAVTGSNVAAAQDLTLAAKGPITIAAAQEADTQSGTAKSSGFTVGVTMDLGLSKDLKNPGSGSSLGLSGPKVSVGVSGSKSSYSGTEVTNIESTLDAGGTTSITTPSALTIDGSTVSGGTVKVDAGSLAIASRQDTSTYQSQSKSASFGASLNLANGQVSVNGNIGNGKQTGTFASVKEQAGIYAGSGGFDIKVDGNTDLKGAAIASEADATKNSLTTGTLTAGNLQNSESWKASQTSLGGGIGGIGANGNGQASTTGKTPLPGVHLGGLGTLSASVPVALSAGGSQQGTTISTIAPGSITITSGDAASQNLAATISRDTSSANAGALTQEFTDQKREEVSQGFAAAQILSTETQAFFARNAEKQAEAKRNAQPAEAAAIKAGVLMGSNGTPLRDDHGNLIPLNSEAATWVDQARPYAEQAFKLDKDWGAGSTARLVITALNGAAGSNVTGSFGSLVQASAVNALQGLGTQQVKQLVDGTPGDDTTREAVRAALQGIVGCAGQTAGGSGDCGSAAMGAAASVVLNNLLKDGKTTATDKEGNALTLEAQQARDNLISTIVGAIAQNTGLNPGSAVTSAQIEGQNNSEKLINGRVLVANPDPNFQLKPGESPFAHNLDVVQKVKTVDPIAYQRLMDRFEGYSPEEAEKRAAIYVSFGDNALTAMGGGDIELGRSMVINTVNQAFLHEQAALNGSSSPYGQWLARYAQQVSMDTDENGFHPSAALDALIREKPPLIQPSAEQLSSVVAAMVDGGAIANTLMAYARPDDLKNPNLLTPDYLAKMKAGSTPMDYKDGVDYGFYLSNVYLPALKQDIEQHPDAPDTLVKLGVYSRLSDQMAISQDNANNDPFVWSMTVAIQVVTLVPMGGGEALALRAAVVKETSNLAENRLATEAIEGLANRSLTGVTPTAGGTLSDVVANGRVIAYSDLTSTEQLLAGKIAAGQDAGGELTEQLVSSVISRTNFKELQCAKCGANNGFDHVIQGPDGGVTIVLDSKQLSAAGSARLSSVNSGAMQLSDDWIKEVIAKLPEESAARQAVIAARDSGSLHVAVGGVDRATKNLVLTPVKFTPPPVTGP